MSIKASIHGPNRRRNRLGNFAAIATLFDHDDDDDYDDSAHVRHDLDRDHDAIRFRIRNLDALFESGKELGDGGFGVGVGSDDDGNGNGNGNVDLVGRGGLTIGSLGDACLFDADGRAGQMLMRRHRDMTGRTAMKEDAEADADYFVSLLHDPPLVHFHDAPVILLRCLPLRRRDATAMLRRRRRRRRGIAVDDRERDEYEDVMYLSKVHCHNHKVCEDTWMTVTCCSRPSPLRHVGAAANEDYDVLSAVQLEVYRRMRHGRQIVFVGAKSKEGVSDIGNAESNEKDEEVDGSDDGDIDDEMEEEEEEEEEEDDDDEIDEEEEEEVDGQSQRPIFRAKDISRAVLNHVPRSVLTVDESIVVAVDGTDLVCRVAEVCVCRGESSSFVANDRLGEDLAAVVMDDPYRGRVSDFTEFYVTASDPNALTIEGGRKLPEGKFPRDVIHVTTSDMEWFPVRRALLAPCLKLTKYVQAGRGKYKEIPTLPDDERSEDAPTDDGCPHCLVPVDCCTFDRVLLFATSLLYPNESTFVPDLSEIGALSAAADSLGLRPLADLCRARESSFESRVRRDRYIRLSEVRYRNDCRGEILIILDGMVLDITRWIDEHPGGPSIIPAQALNMDCTVLFEMYHVSRQSFLYLKSFYIGELSPEDRSELRSSAEGAEVSEAFLRSLKAYTDEWRVKDIAEHPEDKVHKSL